MGTSGQNWSTAAVVVVLMAVFRWHALDWPIDSEEVTLMGMGRSEWAVNPPLIRAVCNTATEGLGVVWCGRYLSFLSSLAAVPIVMATTRALGGSLVQSIGAALLLGFAPAVVQQSALARAYGPLLLTMAAHGWALTGDSHLHRRTWMVSGVVLPWLHYATLPMLTFELLLRRRPPALPIAVSVGAAACTAYFVSGGQAPSPNSPTQAWYILTAIQWQAIGVHDDPPWQNWAVVVACAWLGANLVACRSKATHREYGLWCTAVVTGLLVTAGVARVRHPLQAAWLVACAPWFVLIPLWWERHQRLAGGALAGTLATAMVMLAAPYPMGEQQTWVRELSPDIVPKSSAVYIHPRGLWSSWVLERTGRVVSGPKPNGNCPDSTQCAVVGGRRWYPEPSTRAERGFRLAPIGAPAPPAPECRVIEQSERWIVEECSLR